MSEDHAETNFNAISLNLMPASAKLRLCIRPQCTSPSSKGCRSLATTTNSPRPSLNLPRAALSYHWETEPPTPEQLKHADKFFSQAPPRFLWSAPQFKTMDWGSSPEVCFLGRSNVGKSSVLNAILGRKLAHTSSKPGRTKAMNAFAVGGLDVQGRNRLVVLDMPGYGKGGQAEWGQQVLKYLGKRQELKRAFLLIDTVHGVKGNDEQLLQLFRQHHVPYQVILSKVDKVIWENSRDPSEEKLAQRLGKLRRKFEMAKDAIQPVSEEAGEGLGELISCSSEKRINGVPIGIDAIRFALLRAAGLELKAEPKSTPSSGIVSHEEIFARIERNG